MAATQQNWGGTQQVAPRNHRGMGGECQTHGCTLAYHHCTVFNVSEYPCATLLITFLDSH